MRRDGRCWVLLFAVVALLVPAIGSAATIGAEVFGAYNRYDMTDVNDAIGQANASGAGFDELTGGMTAGAGLRMWASPDWAFMAGWEPLRLSTSSSSNNETWNLNANSFQFTAARFFPSATTSKYGIGAGVGYYSIAGEYRDQTGISDINGSGVGFHVMGLGEWQMSRGFSLTAGVGYRIANIDIDNAPNGETANYSGLMGRVGFAFYMPSAK